MKEDCLLKEARKGEFFSYIAGVAYQALIRYGVGGLEIDNYATTLPIKKGLSSSAAICVLVARAFNHFYNLGLTITEEMELAYRGERTTPSQCGRLDQACAYGSQPILITFDGDQLRWCAERNRNTIKPLSIAQDLYLIIVDLASSKDTQQILTQLNQCYPFAENFIQAQVQNYLGKINVQIIHQAILALQAGDAIQIGNLMNQAQAEFDRHVIPACPEQLNAPRLHQLLKYEPLQPYIYGGKGVGSQGDGTAQLIAGDRISQEKAIAIIQRDFPQMRCYELNIPKIIS